MRTIKFVKNDGSIQFDVDVPKDAVIPGEKKPPAATQQQQTVTTQDHYKFPEPFKVKADDGITDIYGVMYKPFDFDPNKKYPIIAFVYPGVGGRSEVRGASTLEPSLDSPR